MITFRHLFMSDKLEKRDTRQGGEMQNEHKPKQMKQTKVKLKRVRSEK